MIKKIFSLGNYLLGITLLISFFIIFYNFSRPLPDPVSIVWAESNQTSNNNPIEPTTNNSDQVDFDISGAVLEPGHYQLAAGSIIYEGIQAAGGFTDSALLNELEVDLATIITDDLSLYIPSSLDEPIDNQYINNTDNDLININQASADELSTLDSIGPKTAQKIIDYRQQNNFDSIEEIMEVSGIGEKTYEKIKNNITI
ncbi:MAG: helix-hairpin-helix domain-containing protein [Patescibacteria group bacterium]